MEVKVDGVPSTRMVIRRELNSSGPFGGGFVQEVPQTRSNERLIETIGGCFEIVTMRH